MLKYISSTKIRFIAKIITLVCVSLTTDNYTFAGKDEKYLKGRIEKGDAIYVYTGPECSGAPSSEEMARDPRNWIKFEKTNNSSSIIPSKNGSAAASSPQETAEEPRSSEQIKKTSESSSEIIPKNNKSSTKTSHNNNASKPEDGHKNNKSNPNSASYRPIYQGQKVSAKEVAGNILGISENKLYEEIDSSDQIGSNVLDARYRELRAKGLNREYGSENEHRGISTGSSNLGFDNFWLKFSGVNSDRAKTEQVQSRNKLGGGIAFGLDYSLSSKYILGAGGIITRSAITLGENNTSDATITSGGIIFYSRLNLWENWFTSLNLQTTRNKITSTSDKKENQDSQVIWSFKPEANLIYEFGRDNYGLNSSFGFYGLIHSGDDDSKKLFFKARLEPNYDFKTANNIRAGFYAGLGFDYNLYSNNTASQTEKEQVKSNVDYKNLPDSRESFMLSFKPVGLSIDTDNTSIDACLSYNTGYHRISTSWCGTIKVSLKL